MGNLFASTGLGDEKPHERDVEYCGFAGGRPHERQNENPETTAVHSMPTQRSGTEDKSFAEKSGNKSQATRPVAKDTGYSV